MADDRKTLSEVYRKFQEAVARGAAPGSPVAGDFAEARDLWVMYMMKVLEGELPSSAEFDSLVSVPVLRGICFKGTEGTLLPEQIWWAYERILVNEKAQIVRTPYSSKLAAILADAVHVKPSAFCRRQVEVYSSFASVFPEEARRLVRATLSLGRQHGENFVNGFLEVMGDSELRSILPSNLLTLLIIVRRLGEGLGPEYISMVEGIDRGGYEEYAFHHQEGAYPLTRLLDILPEQWFIYTVDNIESLFSVKNAAFSYAVLDAKRCPAKLALMAIRHLSNFKNPQQVRLQIPFDIPDNMSGVALCRMLVFLGRHVENLTGFVTGLPDDETFRSRALEVQVKVAGLFQMAIEARDCIAEKNAAGESACDTFFEVLPALASDEGSLTKLVEESRCFDAEAIGCLMSAIVDYRQAVLRQDCLSGHGFDALAWSRKPSEKEASLFLHIVEKNFPHLFSHQVKVAA